MSKAITLLDLPEEVDFLDEDSVIASLESAAVDLEAVYDDISRLGGVSKTIVAPVLHLIPEEINPKSYTSNPTHTNLSATMEAMDIKQIVLIGAAVVAVGLILTKVVAFLLSLTDTVSKNTKVAAKAAEGLHQSNSKNKRIDDLMTPEIRREYEALAESRIDPRYKIMADLWNPVLKDVLEEGPITRALVNAKSHFEHVEEYIKATAKILREYSNKRLDNDELAAAKAVMTIEAVCFPKYSPETRSILAPIHRVKSAGESTMDDMREINDAFRGMVETSLAVGFNGERALADVDRSRVGTASLDRVDLSSGLKRLEASVKTLENMKVGKDVGRMVETALRKATTSLRQALEVLRMYVTMVSRTINMRNNYIVECHHAAKAITSTMAHAIVTSEDAAAKESLRKISTEK